jgi:RNA polymerase sigma-70 factor (ECF subfamily)
LLFTVAYEMLGSAADADDVLQESWLRWSMVDRSGVRDPRAYLIRTVTRQALNAMRSASRRREAYVGEWLPEPLLTTPDVAEDVELAESVSIAMLTILETLSPPERAVFVLSEVFELPYAEIATALGRKAPAVRQIARRARSNVAARRPRVSVDRSEQQAVVQRFLLAVRTGAVQQLMDVLAPDVVLLADGGGIAPAVTEPLHGYGLVAEFLSRIRPLAAAIEPVALNGEAAVVVDADGDMTTVSVAIEQSLVSRIFVVRNPRKLTRLEEPALLARGTRA